MINIKIALAYKTDVLINKLTNTRLKN